jgi:3-methylfumaryl-CoA hydratase
VRVSISLSDLGLEKTAVASISAEHTERLSSTLNFDWAPKRGESLPLLWHWGHFTPTVPTDSLGRDGHPRPASRFLEQYPRRMWASGRVEQRGQLVIGEPATRTTRLLEAKESEGKSGLLLIVHLEHVYLQFGREQVREEQTLVYRDQGGATALPVGDYQATTDSTQWSTRVVPDPTLLFRFSAVTFNSHRIHYDAPYALEVEGYPALVVHGPLAAILTKEAVQTRLGPISRFEFRANAPLFVGFPFTIIGNNLSRSATVVRNDGVEAMVVTVNGDTQVAT